MSEVTDLMFELINSNNEVKNPTFDATNSISEVIITMIMKIVNGLTTAPYETIRMYMLCCPFKQKFLTIINTYAMFDPNKPKNYEQEN